MDATKVQETLDALGKTFNEFKGELTKKVDLEIKGLGIGEVNEKIAKLNKALDDLGDVKKELEKIQTSNNRKSLIRVDPRTGEERELPADFMEVKGEYTHFLRKGHQDVKSSEATEVPREFRYTKKSLSVISDSDGGYTVTPDMSGRIVTRIWETSPLRDVAAVTTISTDALEGMVDNDQVLTGWVAETGARVNTSTPKIGQWRIPTFEQYAMPIATQKLLDDSAINIEEWLGTKVADKLSRVENTAFVLGDGVVQPRGFLTYPDDPNKTTNSGNTPQGVIEQFVSASSGAVVYQDLNSLVYRLKAGYRQRGGFGMTRGTIGYIRGLLDGFNRPLWEPSLQLGEPSRLLGYPVHEFDDMPQIATSSLAIAFAAWDTFYQIVDRQGVRILRDPYTSKPYVLFYTTKRVGGDVVNFEAGKLLLVHS